MTVGLARASIYAIKKEITIGEYIAPASATDFVPLRPKNDLSFKPEILTSDELLTDIGEAKGSIGKQSVSGSHSAYLKHSGVEGQEPDLGLLYESLLGSKAIASVEFDTIVGSTTTLINVDTGEGVNFQAGQALLIKDVTNGYSIRNISLVTGDALTLNFKLDFAPATGINLGKSILYAPVSNGHPTFSVTKYLGNGFAVESASGNTVTDITIKADANKFGEVDVSFEGTGYLYNPIIITATSKYIDFTDDQGVQVAIVPTMTYANPIQLASAIKLALEGASIETFNVVYDNVLGKFTISSGSTVFSLLFSSGTNVANSINTKIGFAVADLTAAITYTSATEQVYIAPYTPVYDTADSIVIKGAELFVGTVSDNLCFDAQSVSIKISKKVEDVDSICESNGILEKIPTSRTCEMSVKTVLKKHDAALLEALLQNSGVSAMLNAGPKSIGNWIAGSCFNAYMQNCTVSDFKTGGESFISVELLLKGFVTSTGKDIYLGFV
ncbi:MAG: hypothetical protein RIQ94_2912 [Pseudomonadota bacterium]